MTDYGKFYYWFTYIISYILPFVLLLIMNSVIIHTLRQRVNWTTKLSEVQGQRQGQAEGQGSKIRTSEKHIYATLLMVSFMFIVLTSPACVLVVCMMFFDFTKTSTRFAGYHLFYHIGQKALYTNNAINFFLYVASGNKFRKDLISLFRRSKILQNASSSESTKISSITEG